MMNMMHTGGFGTGMTALWGIHVLAVTLFLVGIIFLILWAVKTLNQTQLKTWGIWLVVIGTVVCLLTIGARGAMWGAGGSGSQMMRMERMEKMMDEKEGMMDDDDKMGMMNDNDEAGMMMGNDAMDMSMSGMTDMLEGKTGDEFDEAFIRMMIPHHQGAIDMAKLAQTNAKHGQIREMAIDIASAQQAEIDMMNQWLKDWGYTE